MKWKSHKDIFEESSGSKLTERARKVGIKRKKGESDERLRMRVFDDYFDKGLGYPLPVDLSLYPHECPRCGAPAYVGLGLTVECSGNCQRWRG